MGLAAAVREGRPRHRGVPAWWIVPLVAAACSCRSPGGGSSGPVDDGRDPGDVVPEDAEIGGEDRLPGDPGEEVGREVPLRTLDITGDVVPGTDAVFEYRSFYRGQPYPSEGASLVLSSWLVLEEPRQAPAVP